MKIINVIHYVTSNIIGQLCSNIPVNFTFYFVRNCVIQCICKSNYTIRSWPWRPLL